MGLQAFQEGRMHEAADRLASAASEREMTVSQAVRFETCVYLGAALYNLGRPTEAVKAFETAFQLSPTPVPPAELTLNLAHAYLASGRRDAARAALRYLLNYAPGQVAARMLLQRLETTPDNEPITGTVLGESVESAKTFIHTLRFATVSSGGYDPAQVWEALSQLETYMDTLDQRLQHEQETVRHYEAEIERYQQMEEAMVQNLVQMQQDAQGRPAEPESAQLSPIEILFQKKP
jgi:tetratricopeptide (TPR) repeat protein